MKKIFQFEKKIGWSEIVAIVAAIISSFALWLSYWAWQDSRAISGLNLIPIVHLTANMPKNEHSSSYFTVLNVGPTDALQLEIQLVFHAYSPKTNTIDGSVSTTWHKWAVPSLSPSSQKSFKLPAKELVQRINLLKNPENQVIELQMTYRRQPDKKKYMYSSFYFVNPEGRWVNEEDQSLSGNIYAAIKQSIFRALNKEENPGWNLSDKLHPQKPSLP